VKKVLVMGGAGFIGANLCESLLKMQLKVYCIDNLSSGNASNLRNSVKYSSFEFIEQDVRKEFKFDVDTVFNLASPASPPIYQLNPVGTMLTNFQGTLHGLELARSINARFIQASTSEIYGSPAINPQPETYWGNVNSVGPRSCYDEGKRAAETLCFDFKRQYRVDTRIVRIFNTYGPGMSINDGRVVSNFIVNALKGKALNIYGDGSQTRSFCFIEDLIEGLIRIAEVPSDFSGPINLGNDEEKSMIDLAKLIINLTESKSEIQFSELPQDDPLQRRPDLSLAIKMLNWQPKSSLKLGLRKTIDYFKEIV
jgi:UDP-glucuronate decarboxylase